MYQQNGGFSGALTFPDGRSYTCRGQLIIDFKTTDEHGDEITTTDGQGNHVINYNGISPYWSSSPFQHSYLGCGHTYTQFLQRYDYYPGMVSYIYNPQMPQEAIDADGGELRQSDLHMVDWRELIYQMAIDYFSAQGCDSEHPLYDKNGNEVLSDPDDFLWLVSQLNRDKYPNGYTGYEQYYTDMQGFWRQLYNPNYVPQAIYKPSEYTVQINKSPTSGFYTRDKVLVVGSEIDSINVEYYVSNYSNADLLAAASPDQVQYFIDPLSEDRYKIGWNVNVFENPESLNFWIEFLDNGELTQFSIPQVGDRQKVINDDKVTSIIFKEIPDLILYDKRVAIKDANDNIIGYGPDENIDYRDAYEEQSGYTWIYLPKGFSQYLNISYRNLSAKNKIDQLLYQHAYCIENVSITALPIYHLQPNTRIYVCDKNTGIAGEYIVSKITLPLTYNGTMSITASLAPQRLY